MSPTKIDREKDYFQLRKSPENYLRYGYINLFKILRDWEITINYVNIAAELGRLSVLKTLVSVSPDDRWKDQEILARAVSEGRETVVKYLIQQGLDIHFRNELPLLIAIARKDPIVVKILLRNGADVYVSGSLPIRKAVESGCLKIVQLIVKNADIREIRNELITIAYRYSYSDIIRFLGSP